MLLEVKVEKIIRKYENSRFIIFKGLINKRDLSPEEEKDAFAIQKRMTFKSFDKMYDCIEKDTYTINAKLCNDDKYGVFLSIQDAFLKKIELETELEKYLVNHIPGVGKVKAKKIMEHLGKDAINIISSDEGVAKLSEVVKPGLALTIKEEFIKNQNIFEIMKFLYENNLGVKKANDIIAEYGTEKVLELDNNPYLFSKVIDFKTLDRIAFKRSEIDAKDSRRISAGIISMVVNNLGKGDLFIDVDDIYEGLEDYINTYRSYEKIALTKEEIKEVLTKIKDEQVLTIKNGRCVYMKNIANKEDSLFYNLRRLNNIDNNFCEKEVIEAIKDFEKETKINLSEQQKEAVVKAMTNQLSILTGLPGSGKTLTIKAITNIYSKLKNGAKIKQIAPTGKASKRMQEVSGIEAETIHRALKLIGDIGEGEMIDADFVIVDEASMIDIYLAETLFKNIKAHTKLLIAGDVEQLPSVGPGLILRDMIDSDVIPTTRLTKLFRQAENSNIITNAHAIANKTMDFKFEGDTILWKSYDIPTIKERVKASYMRLLEKGYNREDIVILIPTKNGEIGTEKINKMIQEDFNMFSKEVEINPHFKLKEKDLVIHTENNYDLEVFNGEVGIVDKVKYDENNNPVVEVKYNDKEENVIYIGDDLNQLELAYCLTVHKSQGSEYKAVISIIAENHEFMLKKNLIYTAWTRAKEFLVILGNEETINNVLNRENNEESRKSNLSDMLVGINFSRKMDIQDYINYDEVF